jgi:hypothetical protein
LYIHIKKSKFIRGVFDVVVCVVTTSLGDVSVVDVCCVGVTAHVASQGRQGDGVLFTVSFVPKSKIN